MEHDNTSGGEQDPNPNADPSNHNHNPNPNSMISSWLQYLQKLY